MARLTPSLRTSGLRTNVSFSAPEPQAFAGQPWGLTEWGRVSGQEAQHSQELG